MPFDRPGTLTNDEVYAVTAYLLYLNELITEEQVIDAITLPSVAMPALKYYRSAYQQGAAP
jgi:cytochrome c